MVKDLMNFRKKLENFLNYIYLKTIVRVNFLIVSSRKIRNNLLPTPQILPILNYNKVGL